MKEEAYRKTHQYVLSSMTCEMSFHFICNQHITGSKDSDTSHNKNYRINGTFLGSRIKHFQVLVIKYQASHMTVVIGEMCSLCLILLHNKMA